MFITALISLNIAKKLSWLALSWFVYEITGLTTAIGIVITAATISPLISSILVGGILDSYDRKTIMVYENLSRGVILAIIPCLYWFDILSLPIIVSVMFIDGLLSSFTTVGSTSILPSFVAEEDLEKGNAMISMIAQIGSLLGPALSGLLVGAIGAPGTLWVNVICFLFATLIYALIPRENYHKDIVHTNTTTFSFKKKLSKYLVDTKNGIIFILKSKILTVIAVLTLFFNFTYAPFETVLPAFVSNTLLSGPEILGLMWTFFSIGSLLGAFLWIKLSLKFPYSYSLGSIIILWGLIPIAVSLIREPLLIFGIMLVGGILYAPYNIVAPTLRQKLVPNQFRGRVFGVYGLIAGLGYPLGVYLGGIFGEVIGVTQTVALSGIVTVILGAIITALPTLRFKEVTEIRQKIS